MELLLEAALDSEEEADALLDASFVVEAVCELLLEAALVLEDSGAASAVTAQDMMATTTSAISAIAHARECRSTPNPLLVELFIRFSFV